MSSDNVVSEPRVPPLQPVKLGKKEQRTINKKLASALIRGRGDDIVELVTKGGALAYQNYDAINEAAERGKLKTFQAIFERLSYRQLVDKDLIRDLMEASDEEGHHELHRYLSNYAGNCLEKIEGENIWDLLTRIRQWEVSILRLDIFFVLFRSKGGCNPLVYWFDHIEEYDKKI